MKKIILIAVAVLLSVDAFAAETNSSSEQAEAKYTAAIEERTADILKILALTDADKSAKVHDAVIAQYRRLKAWHDENDAKLKASAKDTNTVAEIRASLKPVHDAFITKLSESLTPMQVEQVKDKLTYGKVQFTFAGYMSAYLNLAEEHQQKILGMLKQAREEAMDGGSADEKTAVFQRYKGKINNYLSKQGVHAQKKTAGARAETNSLPK